MVYESDFYTTRRPYSSSSRPTVSSYSVTAPISYIHIPKVHTYTTTYPIYSSFPTVIHRQIPYVAHKQLVTSSRITTSPTRIIRSPSRFRVISSPIRIVRTPVRIVRSPVRIIRLPMRVTSSPVRVVSVRLRPSIINREIHRIENKVRTHPHYYATENYLNSSDVKDFDDETRDIRTATNALLRRVHTKIERSPSLPPTSYASKYEHKYGPDAFVSRVLAPYYGYRDGIIPPKKSMVGNKEYPRRNPLASTTPASYTGSRKILNEVNVMSYYLKNRKAADEFKSAPYKLESAAAAGFRAKYAV